MKCFNLYDNLEIKAHLIMETTKSRKVTVDDLKSAQTRQVNIITSKDPIIYEVDKSYNGTTINHVKSVDASTLAKYVELRVQLVDDCEERYTYVSNVFDTSFIDFVLVIDGSHHK